MGDPTATDHVESFIRSASTENQRAVRGEILRLRGEVASLREHCRREHEPAYAPANIVDGADTLTSAVYRLRAERDSATASLAAARVEVETLTKAAEVLKRHAVADEGASIPDAVAMCLRMEADEAARKADPEMRAVDLAAAERFRTAIAARRDNRGIDNHRSWQARAETAEATNVRLVMQRDAEREACAAIADAVAAEAHASADAAHLQEDDSERDGHRSIANVAEHIARSVRARSTSPTTAPAHG